MKGIDISVHNGNIDFNTVKNAGVEAIIIKATEGVDFVDSLLENHYEGACGKGFCIGFYHFMSEKTSPTRQAEDFYNAIKDKEYNILPCLDVETNNMDRSVAEITDRCLEFLNRFKQLSGYDCMIYTGGYFGRDNLDSRIKNYPAWIAHYGVAQPMATGFINVVGHQYTENGSISGINGNVDVNNFTNGILIGNKQVVVNNATTQATTDNIYLQLQRELNAQGFKDKNGNKLVEDGIPGELTLSACPLVRKGASGNITTWIQLRCGATPDGIFGTDTENAVKWMQRKWNISDDGIVGPNTWRKLLEL